jgi:hypothetical protein
MKKTNTRLANLVSQKLLFELKQAINNFHESSVTSGFPLVPEHGLAILGSELYSPPLVMCITIPAPLIIDEARCMYNSWTDLESTMLQLPNISVSAADIRNQFIKDTIVELHEHGVNPAYISRLGEFWVAHLKNNGLSFDEQVKRNKKHEVTGHFSLITNSNKCCLLTEEVGHRMNGVTLG